MKKQLHVVAIVAIILLLAVDSWLYNMAFSTTALWPGVPEFILAVLLSMIIILLAALSLLALVTGLVLRKLEA